MSMSQPDGRRMIPVLPLTAMIDILFLLLTFFMVASSLREAENRVDVSLPSTEATKVTPVTRTQITISITSTGEIYIGEKKLTPEELRVTLNELAAQFPDESVLIRGDKESTMGLCVKVMDTAYAAGLKNVYLATTKPKTAGSGAPTR
jgi:biopolymer transport protein ExbD